MDRKVYCGLHVYVTLEYSIYLTSSAGGHKQVTVTSPATLDEAEQIFLPLVLQLWPVCVALITVVLTNHVTAQLARCMFAFAHCFSLLQLIRILY